jgi:hypothetical protein
MRRAPTNHWKTARLAEPSVKTAPSVSAPTHLQMTKILAAPPQPPALAQSATAKSP